MSRFRKLKQKPYWGNHLWARGYCVDTVGLDAEMIHKYVKYQEKQEKKAETSKYQNRVITGGDSTFAASGGKGSFIPFQGLFQNRALWTRFFIYKLRWDVEKVFDEVENKLEQKKVPT